MSRSPAIGLVSLGCAKNLVDTERLTSALIAMGYRISPDYAHSDLIVVNTCGFIGPAQEESLSAIGEALEGQRRVLVMGCLGSRPGTILSRHPEVLKVFGPGRRAAVLREIVKVLGQPPQSAVQRVSPAGIVLTPPHYAYLKIAEGCRHRCAFCIIPSLRGALRSRRREDILREATALKEQGVKELLVIAQDSSDYGFDLGDGSTLSSLIRELAALKLWVRVHYVYPSREATALVELMGEGLVLPYLDVPLQHASEKILKLMRRPGNLEKTLETLEKWRKIRPDLAIRSTFITGFPGETEADFEYLLEFLKAARLDRVGCFPYSNVEGATANAYPDAVPEEVRQERAARLMEIQEQISEEKLAARVGTTCEVLIDEVTEDHVAVGRSMYEAPDVDGVITLENARSLKAGDLVRARITASSTHDLEATLVEGFGASLKFNR